MNADARKSIRDGIALHKAAEAVGNKIPIEIHRDALEGLLDDVDRLEAENAALRSALDKAGEK